MLGLIGYPVFLVGTVLAMFNLIHVTHGAGMLALVPGGLFESRPTGTPRSTLELLAIRRTTPPGSSPIYGADPVD
jgi:hypothetical protein